MKSGHKCETSEKGPQGRGWGKSSIFSIFRKVCENEENHHNLTSGQLWYKNSLIWMKSGHKCETSEKGPQGRGGGNLPIFSIFRKVCENKENHHNLTSGHLRYKNSLIWMKSGHKCEMSEKDPQGRGGGNLPIFSIFRKVCENEDNHYNLTSGQLRYKNSLIWMKSGHVWNERIGSPGPG